MRFLVDAQLPRTLADLLLDLGFDAIHTCDLPKGNSSTDKEVIVFADTHDRIVITKDNDFLDSYLFFGKPKKLIIVSTGNISNKSLLELFTKNIDTIKVLMLKHVVIEIGHLEMIVHQ